MKTTRALLTGILGALSMTVAMSLLRLAGFNVNLEAMLGSLTPAATPVTQWLVGFMLHLGIGAGAGFLYAAAFEMAMQQSGAVIGAGLGLSHTLLAGLFMSGIPAMNPFGSELSHAPGAFLSNVQYGPLFFVGLHLLFGAVVGTCYGPTLEQPHQFGAAPASVR